MFPQLGLGMNPNPYSQFGIGASPTSALDEMSLSPATGGFWSGLHGPQLSNWGGGLGGALQIASIPSVLNDLFTYRDPNQGWLGGGLSGAAAGAGAGSMFGPIGAGIGAGTGYISGKK